MRETSEELFHLAARDAAGPLVAAEQLPGLARALKLLPCTRGGLAFECHLNGPSVGRTDLCVRLFPSDRDRLLRDGSDVPSEILEFLQAWADPTSELAAVPYVDIECDVTDTSQASFLGATVGRRFSGGIRALAEERLASPEDGALRRTLALLQLYGIQTEEHEAVRRQIERCHASLPPLGFLHGAAWLATRASSPRKELRAIVSIPRPELPAYLDRIEWPGDIDLLLRRLHLFRGNAKRVDFDLNIGQRGPTSRIGVYSPAPHHRDNAPELQQNIAFLRAEGVAEDKIGGLLSWCRNRASRPAWVVPIVELKYVWEDDGPTQCKVYLDCLGTYDDDATSS